MNGADAPKEWRAGNFDRVKEYVMGDCQMTNLIVRAIQDAGEVRWLTSKGTVAVESMARLKTAQEVINDPAPDQSWMDTPLPKSKFSQWVQDLKVETAVSEGTSSEDVASVDNAADDLGPLFR